MKSKFLLGMGATGVLVSPVVAVIACGANDKKDVFKSTRTNAEKRADATKILKQRTSVDIQNQISFLSDMVARTFRPNKSKVIKNKLDELLLNFGGVAPVYRAKDVNDLLGTVTLVVTFTFGKEVATHEYSLGGFKTIVQDTQEFLNTQSHPTIAYVIVRALGRKNLTE